MKAMQFDFKHMFLFLFFIVVLLECIIADDRSEILQTIRAPHRIPGNYVIDGTAMAATSGLGALPFFFVELDPEWAGICNGMAAGVMLAASFDLIREGKEHGAGSWVVVGILAGGIFILLCKKNTMGEVSVLDIKGADATKAFFVIGIMTLHSYGEGSGVRVSFSGSKGFTQGLLVTMAIAVHNIPEGLAVSMVLASRGVYAMEYNYFLTAGSFANSCGISSYTFVAFMEALSILFQNFSRDYSSEDASGFFVSLLSGLGPLLGGLALVSFALAFRLKHALLMGAASIVAFVLGAWRPLQLLVSLKMGFFPLMICNEWSDASLIFSGAVTFHELAEGLALGVTAPKAYGLGRHMVLPVSLHGLPRGAAVASCVFRATDSWHGSLVAASLIGFVVPISAIGSILAGID
ncbi:putative zinc transporter [Hibiscus syriacus]|uniref:Zinc transporter n=1 Tax=Hibiscus syriacus TaxID=106335 RepID=A0A6A2ZU50_HIBSY|nr:putative zinc transporter [Hibiscus syriacus]